jgi:hypothetical protein
VVRAPEGWPATVVTKQVLAASHQIGADTVITADANDSITLLGRVIAQFARQPFRFCLTAGRTWEMFDGHEVLRDSRC